jgi:hypothetical protein
MIHIQRLTPALEAQYCHFLLADPRTLIYASLEFRDFLLAAIPGASTTLLALDSDHEIIGALSYFQSDMPGVGRVINSLPWYGTHGGCIVRGNFAREARRALLTCYRDVSSKRDVLSSTIVLSHTEESALDEYLFILQPSALDYRIGQVTELPSTGPDLERRILQKTRNLVRKALRQPFVLSIQDDDIAWQFLYQTHADNMSAIGGKAKPLCHFQAMRKSLPSSFRRLYLARLNDEIVAAVLLFYFNKTVEYITPVIKHEYRSSQPLSFLIWHAMHDAISDGFRWWNWGGTWSSQKSLHHFKSGWGAQNYPYTYLITSSEEGRASLIAHSKSLTDYFPYYYTYPYDRL